MTNTEIKLILLDYKEFDYVPELNGYYINNLIIVENSILDKFILEKYNLNHKVLNNLINDNKYESLLDLYILKLHPSMSYVFEFEMAEKYWNYMKFYLNLLNFNNYSSWQVFTKEEKIKLIKRCKDTIFEIKSEAFIIYRTI